MIQYVLFGPKPENFGVQNKKFVSTSIAFYFEELAQEPVNDQNHFTNVPNVSYNNQTW